LTEAVFKKFFEVAEIAAFSETERYDYEENLKNYNDWFSVMNTAKNEGIAEGRAEGLAEGEAIGMQKGRTEGLAEGEAIGMEKGRTEGEAIAKQEMAKSLKSQGVPTDVIAKASGLTAEEIERL
jgi:flagellar biosynthesis/type III secretory pathway protein FliH